MQGSEASREPPAGTRLIPLVEWPEIHLWPPLGGLRHLVLHRHTNGFDAVIRRVGRRVLLDEQEFFAWVRRVGSHP